MHVLSHDIIYVFTSSLIHRLLGEIQAGGPELRISNFGAIRASGPFYRVPSKAGVNVPHVRQAGGQRVGGRCASCE